MFFGRGRLVLVFIIKCTERTTPGASFIAGFYVDGNVRPGILDFEIGFQMIREIMGLVNCHIPRYHKMEFNKYLRSRTTGP